MKQGTLLSTLQKIMDYKGMYEHLYFNKFDKLDEIYKFPERYKLPKLSQAEIDYVNRSMPCKEIELEIKTFLAMKSPVYSGVVELGELYQFKEELILVKKKKIRKLIF